MEFTSLIKPVSLLSDPQASNDGSLYFNTASNVYRYFISGSWISLIDAKEHVTNVVSKTFLIGGPTTAYLSYTLNDDQIMGGTISVYAASAALITIPDESSVDTHIGSSFKIIRSGPGSVGIMGAENVNILKPSSVYLTARYSTVTIIKLDEDLWLMSGEFPDIY